jgi:hypothetical protein
MNKKILLIFTLLMIGLCGCANQRAEQRIAKYKEYCALMGFEKNSSENAMCILELEKAYLSRNRNAITIGSTTYNDRRTQEMIDNDRIRRQILNHGAGGCTPNFATGGCL